MISVTIGLIIIAAVFSAYLGAASASKMAAAQSAMDEDAQAALTILTQQLRLAGSNPEQNWTSSLNYRPETDIYNPVYLPAPIYLPPYAPTYAPFLTPTYVDASGPAFTLSAYALRGCQGSFSNVTTASSLDALTCVTGAEAPNSFGVSYEADIYNTVPANSSSTGADASASAEAPTDCLGNLLNKIDAKIPQPPSSATSAAPATYDDAYYYAADNRFYIQADPSQRPSLYCQGNGISSVAQPLIQNVEDMQISYGVMAPGQTKSTVAGYLQADQLLAETTFGDGITEDLRWSQVATVRICLQLVSAARVVSNVASASYVKCDGSVQAGTSDLRLRRTYTTTVVLRNRLL